MKTTTKSSTEAPSTRQLSRWNSQNQYPCLLFLLLSCLFRFNNFSGTLAEAASSFLDDIVVMEPDMQSPAAPSEDPVTADDPEEETPEAESGAANDDSFLLLCLTDGSIYSVSAWTGAYRAKITTHPLLQTNRAEDMQSDSNTAVLPGLDGRLYYTNEQTQQLQELPLTIHSLLENPVRSCDPEHPEVDCGILTAEAETSLLALSPTGEFLWKTFTNNGPRDDQLNENSNGSHHTHLQGSMQPPLLLQRKDYWVQHVLVSNGKQSWNVSLGTYQALDFGPEDGEEDEEDDDQGDEDDDDNYLLTDGSSEEDVNVIREQRRRERENRRKHHPISATASAQQALPAVHFSNAGHTLTAVHPVTGDILWRQNVPSVLSSVFGIHKGQWKSVEVLQQGHQSHQYQYPNPNGGDVEYEEEEEDIDIIQSPSASDTSKNLAALAEIERESERTAGRTSTPQDYQQMLWMHHQPHRVPQPTSAYFSRKLPYISARDRLLKDNARATEFLYETETCTAQTDDDGNFIGYEGWCPLGWNHHGAPQLRLPSPPAVQRQPEGLLLSWPLVTLLMVLSVLAVAVFRFWYVRKKIKWTTSIAQKANNIDDSMVPATTVSVDSNTRSQSIVLPVRQGPLKRSLSLPGAWGVPDPAHKDFDVSSNHSLSNKSEPGEALPRQESNSSGSEGLLEHNISAVGGFPLVRYSRYACEFKEMQSMGKGGFGTVFKCANMLDGRDYAIKKVIITALTPNSMANSNNPKKSPALIFQKQLQRVLREVKILAVLDHPNIVRYYTAWLEIMQDDDKENSSSEKEESSSYLIRSGRGSTNNTYSHQCYSSSLLLTTDSASQWDTVGGRGRPSPPRNYHRAAMNYNPLGWNNGLDTSSSEDLTLGVIPRRRSLRMQEEDYLIFEEDSKEEEDPSSSASPSQTSQPEDATIQTASPEISSQSTSRCGNITSFEKDRKSESSTSDRKIAARQNHSIEESKTIPASSAGGDQDSSTWSKQQSVDPSDTTSRPKSSLQNSSGKGTSSSSTLPSPNSAVIRHTLYIQMELCSQKTISDFLSDPDSRGRPAAPNVADSKSIDIPKALRLFLQIAEAVKHVHSQGLIHRDLKPSNCFLNEAGTMVKVGDFGLSRQEQQSSGRIAGNMLDSMDFQSERGDSSSHYTHHNMEDHTAGVGTRSYASPEQICGSDYDSSTDVYSLGIMLFELLYPMYTGMERNICLSHLRESLLFPKDWSETIGMAFPDLEDMIQRMVRREPSARPSAEAVAKHVSSILGEFTVLALDQNHDEDPDVFLLRVEAEHREDTLGHTIRLIHEIAAQVEFQECRAVKIVQYGLRSSSSSDNKPAAIMEFALKYCPGCDSHSQEHRYRMAFLMLVSKLTERPEVYKARQISSALSTSV